MIRPLRLLRLPRAWRPLREAAASLVVLMAALLPLPLAAGEQVAEQPSLLGTTQPGRDRALPEAGPPPNFDFTIQAPRRSPVPRAAEELSFEAKDIQVAGVTAYKAEVIRPLIAPLIGKRIHLADLVTAAERIEALYRADGYLLSRAFVPAQAVSNGIFQITVVEGYVAAVSVVGGDEAARHRVEALLAAIPASRPLKVGAIEAALVLANETPGLTASGLLRPSASEPGASDFVVTVTTVPYTGAVSVDNRGSQSTGKWTVSADAAARSPWSDGGQVMLNASSAPDSISERRSLQAKYLAPIGLGGMTGSLSGLISHGEPAGSTAALKLVSNSIAVGPHLSYPLLLNRQDKLSLDGGFTVQSADVHALGAALTHDEWRNVDLALVYQNSRFLDGVSNLTVDYARGLTAFGASASNSAGLSRQGGRTDFNKVTALLRHTRILDGPLSLSLSANGQYAFDTLLTGEEISFGGAALGRGYDPGSLTGDSGVGGSIELRYDLDATDLFLDSAQLYSFYDAAKAWSRTGIINNKLGSSGIGLRGVAFQDASLGVEVSHVFIPLPGNDSGKRSSRASFNGSVRF